MNPPPGYRRNDAALIAERSRALGLTRGEAELESFLPLTDAAYLVLLALARDSDRGLFETLEEGVGELALGPGDLVRSLDRLIELGLVAASLDAAEHYHVTALGDAVLFAETGRRRRRSQPRAMPKLGLLRESKHAMY